MKGKKTGGRTKGSTNKASGDVKERVADIVSDKFGEFTEKLGELDGEAYCRVYLKLMEFVLPKQRELSGTVQVEPVKVIMPDGFAFELV